MKKKKRNRNVCDACAGLEYIKLVWDLETLYIFRRCVSVIFIHIHTYMGLLYSYT